uniref:F-box domain-containing protein n=1 Tax=Leersia perrieri TaxID=77586 RepID=A0A0D9X8N6_9ORYZ
MPPGEPTAKRRRLPAGEPDDLAALPPEIVDNIISRLNIREVVRTSVLSHAWRRRWESVRGLNLSFRSSDPAAAISSVLKRSTAPVSIFHLYIPGRRFHRAVRWLRILPTKRVQSLDLDFESSLDFPDKPNLDPIIFSCLDLTSLCLEGCVFPPPPPPSFVGFLKLTKLELSEIELPLHGEKHLEAIIAASPLLLELSLACAQLPRLWFVRGPNIRSLNISTDDDYVRIGELPQLEDVTISASSVKTEGVFNGNPPERFPFTFQNLRSLNLLACLDQIPSTSFVFAILRCAPNLEKLGIEVDCDTDEVDDAIVEGFANAETNDDIFPRLRYVRLHGSIGCSSNEMCFIKFVLSKARSLELFCVLVHSQNASSYKEALIEMATYKRASPRARLRFICR